VRPGKAEATAAARWAKEAEESFRLARKGLGDLLEMLDQASAPGLISPFVRAALSALPEATRWTWKAQASAHRCDAESAKEAAGDVSQVARKIERMRTLARGHLG